MLVLFTQNIYKQMPTEHGLQFVGNTSDMWYIVEKWYVSRHPHPYLNFHFIIYITSFFRKKMWRLSTNTQKQTCVHESKLGQLDRYCQQILYSTIHIFICGGANFERRYYKIQKKYLHSIYIQFTFNFFIYLFIFFLFHFRSW